MIAQKLDSVAKQTISKLVSQPIRTKSALSSSLCDKDEDQKFDRCHSKHYTRSHRRRQCQGNVKNPLSTLRTSDKSDESFPDSKSSFDLSQKSYRKGHGSKDDRPTWTPWGVITSATHWTITYHFADTPSKYDDIAVKAS